MPAGLIKHAALMISLHGAEADKPLCCHPIQMSNYAQLRQEAEEHIASVKMIMEMEGEAGSCDRC